MVVFCERNLENLFKKPENMNTMESMEFHRSLPYSTFFSFRIYAFSREPEFFLSFHEKQKVYVLLLPPRNNVPFFFLYYFERTREKWKTGFLVVHTSKKCSTSRVWTSRCGKSWNSLPAMLLRGPQVPNSYRSNDVEILAFQFSSWIRLY